MNIHRQLAADYSELAYQVSRNVCHFRGMMAKKPRWGTKTRWVYRSFLRREQAKLIAYAEQVEHHLADALSENRPSFHPLSTICISIYNKEPAHALS